MYEALCQDGFTKLSPDQCCRCKHECPWMMRGPYDGVEELPCDTWSVISHTWLPLINQVRGPSLTQEKCLKKSPWQMTVSFFSAFYLIVSYSLDVKEERRKHFSSYRSWNKIRDSKLGIEGPSVLPLMPTTKELSCVWVFRTKICCDGFVHHRKEKFQDGPRTKQLSIHR